MIGTNYMRQLFAEEDAQDHAEGAKKPDKAGEAAGGKDNHEGGEEAGKGKNEPLTLPDDVFTRIVEAVVARQQAAQDEAAKLAGMTAQERAEHERDEYKKQLDALKKDQARAQMSKTARGILAGDGVNISDDLVDMLVTDDAEETKTRVAAFTAAFKAAVKAAVTEQLRGKVPAAGGGHQLTKAEIMKVTNRAERQRLIAENISLFR